MAAVRYEDLLDAFSFVSAAALEAHQAFIALDTGQVFWVGGDSLDEEIPDDIETSDRYLGIPHRNELDLGRALVFRFVQEELPHEIGQVRAFFSKGGAYARFKDLLDRNGRLQQWYEYEARHTERALRDWCGAHGVELLPPSSSPA